MSFVSFGDLLASLLLTPGLGFSLTCLSLVIAGCVTQKPVTQKLASLRMAIREEAQSQKAVAIDAGIDEGQFARKLSNAEPMTLRDIAKFPERVQAAWHLAELSRLGLPERVQKWIAIGRVVSTQKRSA